MNDDLLAVLRQIALPFVVVLCMLGLLLIGFRSCSSERSAVRSARAEGAATVAADTATKGIENATTANAAAEAVRRDPAVRRVGCLRYSRTPANCP